MTKNDHIQDPSEELEPEGATPEASPAEIAEEDERAIEAGAALADDSAQAEEADASEEAAEAEADVSEEAAPAEASEPSPAEDDSPAPEEGTSPEPEEQEHTDKLGETLPKEVPTALMPQVEESPQQVEASLGDVARTAGSYARGRIGRLKEFLGSHALLVGICCACLVTAILGIVLYAQHAASLPELETVEQDARDHFSTANYTPGSFDSSEQLSLVSVIVTSRHKDKGSLDECEASVDLQFASGKVTSSQRAILSYVRKDGIWTCVEAKGTKDSVFAATGGVDDQALTAHLDEVLKKAEAADKNADDQGLSLLTIYRDAKASVVDRHFDESAQTYDAKVHLERASTFTSYDCTVTASFAFRQGTGMWELTQATASSGAKDVRLTPLVGTWVGSFQKQTSTGAKCFGAKETELKVSISSAEKGKVRGTLDMVAHLHEEPSEDAASSEGDVALSDIAFEGTLDETSSGISFVCELPEDERGQMSLRLDFGSPADPDAAIASVTTTYDYDSTLFILSIPTTASYTDTFALVKQ